MYLGIDLGSKTMGMALSSSGIIAETYKTYRFEEENYEKCFNQLLKEIDELFIKTLVIGLPKHMNNDIGIRANISIEFKEKLSLLRPKLEVILLDERLSTREVKNVMILQNQRRDKYKEKKDELAACLILQTYLDMKK